MLSPCVLHEKFILKNFFYGCFILILKQTLMGEDQPSYVCPSSFPNGLDKKVPGCKLGAGSLLWPYMLLA